MSNFVIFKDEIQTQIINIANLLNINIYEKQNIQFVKLLRHEFYLEKKVQKKEEALFLKNIQKALQSGFVDFTDDKLYDFSFENQRAKDAGGVNNKFIDSDLKAEYKKELDFYYQKMLNLIIANNDLKFAEFMYAMSDFFANVLSESNFNETPFELREKFYDYLTDKFIL